MSGPLELARKYRPGRWDDFRGQRPSTVTLYRMGRFGTTPAAMLFYGESGCGKTTMARIVAKALNCESEPGSSKVWPCGTCASCEAIAAGISPDVEEVDAASNGTVETVQHIRARAGMGPAGKHLVFIVDEAHAVSRPGSEALLKTFEESLPGVVFILCTTRPDLLPEPLYFRCHRFLFGPLPAEVITERLEQVCAAEGIEHEPGLLAAITEASRGGMRDALMRLDQVASAKISSLRMWRELTGETDFAPALLTAAAAGDYPAVYGALAAALGTGDHGHVTGQLVRTLTDALVLTVPGTATALQGEALEARRSLAGRLGPARIFAALQVLWELQAKVRTGDRDADLMLAVAMISRRIGPAPAAEPIAPGGASRDAIARLQDVLGAPACPEGTTSRT